MGLCNLRHVDGEIEKRKLLARQYEKRLSGVEGIRLCRENPRVRKNYAYMPVVFDGYKRDRDWILMSWPGIISMPENISIPASTAMPVTGTSLTRGKRRWRPGYPDRY